MSDNDSVLLEDINHQLKAVLEGIKPMASVPVRLDKIDERLATIESDMKAVKGPVKDLSHDVHAKTNQLNDYEVRITTLERAV